MGEVNELRKKLKQKEADYRSKLSKESDDFEGQVFKFLKNLSLGLGILIGGYFIMKLILPKSKKEITTDNKLKAGNNEDGSIGFSNIIKQKLLMMVIQIGLTFLTAKLKEKLENPDNASATSTEG